MKTADNIKESLFLFLPFPHFISGVACVSPRSQVFFLSITLLSFSSPPPSPVFPNSIFLRSPPLDPSSTFEGGGGRGEEGGEGFGTCRTEEPIPRPPLLHPPSLPLAFTTSASSTERGCPKRERRVRKKSSFVGHFNLVSSEKNVEVSGCRGETCFSVSNFSKVQWGCVLCCI